MTPHLIIHKVRGLPTLDVAEQLENGWWIIPTSGHRAYPYAIFPLEDFTCPTQNDPNWDNLPDHYPNKLAPDLLTPPIRRRVASAADLDF
jgi:hypothetical protein